jgi:uncharacterized protein YciI
MYAVAIIRYRLPLQEVLKVVDEHRSYLRELKKQGILLASGPFDPRTGGLLLLRLPEGDPQVELDRIQDHDPFVVSGAAQYEMWPWAVNLGIEDLDKL